MVGIDHSFQKNLDFCFKINIKKLFLFYTLIILKMTKWQKAFVTVGLLIIGSSTFAANTLSTILNNGSQSVIDNAATLATWSFGSLVWQIWWIALLFVVVWYLFRIIRKR